MSASKYYYANRERLIKQQMDYVKRHPEMVKAASARFYRKNAERIQARQANRVARKASVFRDAF